MSESGGGQQMADENGKPTIFISYCQKDRVWLERLEKQLAILKHRKNAIGIEPWHDQKIDGGAAG